jgi:hypothetical protein
LFELTFLCFAESNDVHFEQDAFSLDQASILVKFLAGVFHPALNVLKMCHPTVKIGSILIAPIE